MKKTLHFIYDNKTHWEGELNDHLPLVWNGMAGNPLRGRHVGIPEYVGGR